MGRGTIVIEESYCKGCELCNAACPPKVLELDNDKLTSKGYHPTHIFKDGCTGCAICALVCPDAAITVYREITKAPAPELAGKIKAQQSAGRVDIDLVLTGTDGLAAGIEQGLWVQLLPQYSAKFPGLDANFLPGAAGMQKLAENLDSRRVPITQSDRKPAFRPLRSLRLGLASCVGRADRAQDGARCGPAELERTVSTSVSGDRS